MNYENKYKRQHDAWIELKTFWQNNYLFNIHKSSAVDASKCIFRWKRVKPSVSRVEDKGSCFGNLPFPTCRRFLTPLHKTTLENIVAKGEISHDE